MVMLVALAASIACGALVARSALMAVVVLVIPLGAGLAAAFPGLALAAGMMLTVLPYTWSPAIGPLTATPGLFVAMALGALGALRLLTVRAPGAARPSAADGLVVGLGATALVSSYVLSQPPDLFVTLLVSMLVPYVGFRVFMAAYAAHLEWRVAMYFIAVAIPVAVVACVEGVQAENPLTGVLLNPELQAWAEPVERGGAVRAASSFGHPLALGTFLVIPIGCALFGLHRRWPWLLLFLGAEILTLSRGPWLAVVLVVILLAPVTWKRAQHPRAVGLLVIAAVSLLFAGPISSVFSSSFTASTPEVDNATYRVGLINASLENLTLLGNPQVESTRLLAGYSDVTSSVALTASRTGAVGLLFWLALGGWVLWCLVRAYRRRQQLIVLISAIVLAQYVSLLSFPLITNYQYVFWLTVAWLASVVTPTLRRARRTRYLPAG